MLPPPNMAVRIAPVPTAGLNTPPDKVAPTE